MRAPSAPVLFDAIGSARWCCRSAACRCACYSPKCYHIVLSASCAIQNLYSLTVLEIISERAWSCTVAFVNLYLKLLLVICLKVVEAAVTPAPVTVRRAAAAAALAAAAAEALGAAAVVLAAVAAADMVAAAAAMVAHLAAATAAAVVAALVMAVEPLPPLPSTRPAWVHLRPSMASTGAAPLLLQIAPIRCQGDSSCIWLVQCRFCLQGAGGSQIYHSLLIRCARLIACLLQVSGARSLPGSQAVEVSAPRARPQRQARPVPSQFPPLLAPRSQPLPLAHRPPLHPRQPRLLLSA